MLSKIKQIRKIEKELTRYNLEVEDNHNYFANNILVHNCRCLAFWNEKEQRVVLSSRKGKEQDILPHLNSSLLPILSANQSYVLDGELYNHGVKFQKLISMVKRDEAKKDSSTVQYNIYDMFDLNNLKLNFLQRFGILYKIIKNLNSIQLVETFKIYSPDEVTKYHKEMTDKGYEGIMVRNADGLYQQDKRSVDLQKVKDFLDEEFLVTGVETGKGRFNGMAIFQLTTKEGAEFAAMPRGTEQERKDMWVNKDKYVGEMMTVRFFEWSSSKPSVPRFPVALPEIRSWHE